MSLQEQLKSDMKEAMKAKDIVKRDTIRFLNSAIKQVEVDERRELSDADIIKLIQKSLKQREDSIAQFGDAGRDDLVQKEQAQADILIAYLPKQLTPEELKIEVKAIIEEVGATSMKDIGKIMGTANKKLAGITDGKKINECAKELLS
jgi:uncharacterized protein YqeY